MYKNTFISIKFSGTWCIVYFIFPHMIFFDNRISSFFQFYIDYPKIQSHTKWLN